MSAVLEVISAGGGATLQDLGRPGWKRHGMPPGGAMDGESARQANRLVGNAEGEAVMEFLLSGARLRALAEVELAVTGAEAESNRPRWRSFVVKPGEEISLGACRAGVWTYLAVRGGFLAPRWFGSASTYARAGLGGSLTAGAVLERRAEGTASAVAGRFVSEANQPRWGEALTLTVWAGPEWERFSGEARERFLEQTWTVSPQSDRAGYRLEGEAMEAPAGQILSAPLRVGTLQVPPGGKPIVILRDGPTVGGYPRLAMLEEDAVSRFTQCAPGTEVRFRLP